MLMQNFRVTKKRALWYVLVFFWSGQFLLLKISAVLHLSKCLLYFSHFYSVYPTEPDEVDRDDNEFSSRPDDDDDDDDDDEDDDEDDDTDEPASASAFASRPAATSISASERPSKPQGI